MGIQDDIFDLDAELKKQPLRIMTDLKEAVKLAKSLTYLAAAVEAHADKFPVPSHMRHHAAVVLNVATLLPQIVKERDEALSRIAGSERAMDLIERAAKLIGEKYPEVVEDKS